MALIWCDFSDVLELGTSMTVLLPQQTTAQIGVDSAPAQQGPPAAAPPAARAQRQRHDLPRRRDAHHGLGLLPRLDPARGHLRGRPVDGWVRRGAVGGLAVTDSFGRGEHGWGYWDATIQDVLAWLFVDRP